MKAVLQKKGHSIVMGLLDIMSNKNKHNFEKTLTANTILMEFCENDYCFNLLTTPDALQRLIQVCC